VRAAVITRPGGPEVLEVRDVPDPVPCEGEVLLEVAASAVNRADLMQREGNYPPPPGASEYPGLEASGTIAELGLAVEGWSPGDRAMALLAGGGYAERCVASPGSPRGR
jgi:NADPH:quinone reductase-like Zn-dependent oxidoreductase